MTQTVLFSLKSLGDLYFCDNIFGKIYDAIEIQNGISKKSNSSRIKM